LSLFSKTQEADRRFLTIRLWVLDLWLAFRCDYATARPRIFDPWRHHQMLLNALTFMSVPRRFSGDWRVV